MRLQIFLLTLMIYLASCSNSYPSKIENNPNYKYTPDEKLIRQRCGPHATLCHSMDNYPIDLVHQHMKERPNQVEQLLRKSQHVDISIDKRIGVGEGDAARGDTEMCKSRNEVMPAQVGITKDDTWKYIFNNGEFGIEAIYCENPGADCIMTFPGFIMTCEQKYFYKILTSLDPSDGTTSTDEFKVPAGCVCNYKRA